MHDLNDLKNRFQRYDEYYSTWYKTMREVQKYYDSDFEITKPDDIPAILPPTARTRIDTAVIELISNAPRVHRKRPDRGTNEQKHDDDIEAALQSLLLDVEEFLQTPVLFEAAKLQLLRGAAVLAGPFYDDHEDRCWFDVYDPLMIYMEPGPRPREGFIHHKLTVAEMEQLAAQYAKLKDYDRGTRTPLSEITFIEWYYCSGPSRNGSKGDEYLHAAWIAEDNDWLVEPHHSGYPYLPLDMVYSGWGRRTPGAKPEEIGVPLLHPGVLTLLRAEAELFTLRLNYAQQAAWGRYKLPPGVPLADDFVIETLPNTITRGVPPELELFPTLPMPQDMPAHFDLVESKLDDALFSRVLAGQRQPGVSTATGLQLLSGRARQRFHPPVRMLQAGLSRMLEKVGCLLCFLSEISNEDKKFVWRGYTLASSMYGRDKDYKVEVDLAAMDEEERRVRVAEGTALEGKMPRSIIWPEYYGLENYSDAMEQFLFERIVFSDDFIKSLLQEFQVSTQPEQSPGGGVLPQPGGVQAQPPQAGVGQGVGGGRPGGVTAIEKLASLYRAASETPYTPTQPGSLAAGAQAVRRTRTVMP